MAKCVHCGAETPLHLGGYPICLECVEAGGGAAITACGLAKLGVDVTAVGIVGKADGDFVLDRLKACAVNCSGIQTHPSEPTGQR